jgi:hypothetical protein
VSLAATGATSAGNQRRIEFAGITRDATAMRPDLKMLSGVVEGNCFSTTINSTNSIDRIEALI